MKPKRAATAVLVAQPKSTPKSPHNKKAHKPGNFRILMVKRSSKSNWMKDIYVFPGGSVDENDFPSDSLSLLTRSGRHAPNWEGDSNSPLLHPFVFPVSAKKDKTNTNRDLSTPAEIAFAFRTAALREIFEESGLLSTPSSSSRTSTPTPALYPALAPVDLDFYFNTLHHSPALQKPLIPFAELAETLKIPIHEVFRRIVHLNDQETLDSINAAILAQKSQGNSITQHTTPPRATFLDLCTSLGIAETYCGDNALTPYTAFDTITPIAKWISPPQEKKRFDTIFYLSVVDPEQIHLKSMSGDDDQHDSLDAAMSHFHNLSVKQQDQSPSLEDPNCKISKKLISSTLSNEISDISWISPIDMLNRLDQVTFAPPTQYILSQLSGFTLTELEQLIQSPQDIDKLGFGFGYDVHTYFDEQRCRDQRETPHTPIIHKPTLIPFCPQRLDTISIDPYTYLKAKAVAQEGDGKNGQALSEQQKSNSHFASQSRIIGEVAVNTKGHVLLPGDFEHPLTQPLLLRTLELLEQNSPPIATAPATPIVNTPDTPAHNQYAQFAHLGKLEQNHIDAITSVEHIESIFDNQLLPPIKLSNVSLYSTPLQFLEQHPEVAESSSPLISRVLNSNHKAQMSKLIHYHRVVDALTHNNWEIVVSNPRIVYKSREDLTLIHSEASQAKL